MIFESSYWGPLEKLQLFMRYGLFTLFRMRSYLQGMLAEFGNYYDVIDKGQWSADVTDVLNSMNPTFLNDTDESLRQRLVAVGLTKELIDELVMIAVRTNYGQTPDSVHAFVGSVALAGATDGLWAVKHGNKQVVEQCLEQSHVRLEMARVSKVSRKSDTGEYVIHFRRLAEPGPLYDEGEDGIVKTGTDGRNDTGVFDIVVVATPLTKDKSDIKFEGFDKSNLNRATDPSLR